MWETLLCAARNLGSGHVSLLGSAVRKSLDDVSDIDIHLVIPRMDRAAYEMLAAAAESAIREVAAPLGRPWLVELRHGPFKPSPSSANVLQLHLLLDDDASVERLPCALVAQRAATGVLLEGKALLGERVASTRAETWIHEARLELERWRSALEAEEIAFRHWTFDPAPQLVEDRSPARTPWERSLLLRGAARSSDLFYRAASWMASRDLATPLLSELGGEPPWESLDAGWGEVRVRAMAIISRRLEELSRWVPSE